MSRLSFGRYDPPRNHPLVELCFFAILVVLLIVLVSLCNVIVLPTSDQVRSVLPSDSTRFGAHGGR